ncbi:hypothetical protein D3C85_1127860 [compost metagenome]
MEGLAEVLVRDQVVDVPVRVVVEHELAEDGLLGFEVQRQGWRFVARVHHAAIS